MTRFIFFIFYFLCFCGCKNSIVKKISLKTWDGLEFAIIERSRNIFKCIIIILMNITFGLMVLFFYVTKLSRDSNLNDKPTREKIGYCPSG